MHVIVATINVYILFQGRLTDLFLKQAKAGALRRYGRTLFIRNEIMYLTS
jgi:hypothetical protein